VIFGRFLPRDEAQRIAVNFATLLAESLKRGRGSYGPLLQFRQEPRNDKEMGKALSLPC